MQHFVLNEQLWLDQSTVCFLLVCPYSLSLFGGRAEEPVCPYFLSCGYNTMAGMYHLLLSQGHSQQEVRDLHQLQTLAGKALGETWCNWNNMHWSKINIFSLICCKLTVVTRSIYGVFPSGFSVLVNPFWRANMPLNAWGGQAGSLEQVGWRKISFRSLSDQ